MGRPAIEALNFISRVNYIDSSVKLYPDLFTGLGTLGVEYHIQDAKPYAITTPRRVALPLLPKVKRKLGKHGCNYQGRRPYRLVCGYGCCAQTQQQHSHLC